MTDYHNPRGCELTTLQSVADLQRFLQRTRSPEETFEAYERALNSHMRLVECELKELELARYDVDEQRILIGDQEYLRCLSEEPKKYLSSSGPLTVARNLFRPVGGGKAVCPLELRAGIIGASSTRSPRTSAWLMALKTALTARSAPLWGGEPSRRQPLSSPIYSSCGHQPGRRVEPGSPLPTRPRLSNSHKSQQMTPTHPT